jgi:hypothetical protein
MEVSGQLSVPAALTLCTHWIRGFVGLRPGMDGMEKWKFLVLQTNSVAFSPQAIYTDWATATCWRNLVPTFADRGLSRGQRGGSPMVVNLSFLHRSRYFSFKCLLIYPHKGSVDPVPDTLLLRKSVSAGNRTWNLCVCSKEIWSS